MLSLAVIPLTFFSPQAYSLTAPSIHDLKKDLESRKTSQFDTLLLHWEARYGTRAVKPLYEIATNSKTSDADRYIALMGMGRLGGKDVAPLTVKFLKDDSWMIRNASLQLLQAMDAKEHARDVLPLLKDPALVVRMEAIEAVQNLKPEGAEKALLETLFREENYHHGKAQWAPQKALAALVELKPAPTVAQQLKPLLTHEKDTELLLHTVWALERMTGKTLKKGAPLAEKVAEWRLALK